MSEKITKKQKADIYLKAAKKISDESVDNYYVCRVLKQFGNLEDFNEVFLFKDNDYYAWLSHWYLWEAKDEEEIISGKQIVLLFCHEMCK